MLALFLFLISFAVGFYLGYWRANKEIEGSFTETETDDEEQDYYGK